MLTCRLYPLRVYMHLSIFQTKHCNIDSCACLSDPDFERTVNIAEVQKNFHLLHRTAISSKFFGVLSNFYLMISSKDNLRPYHIHAKLVIIFYYIKWSPETTHPLATKRKKVHFYLHVPPCVRTFLLFWACWDVC